MKSHNAGFSFSTPLFLTSRSSIHAFRLAPSRGLSSLRRNRLRKAGLARKKARLAACKDGQQCDSGNSYPDDPNAKMSSKLEINPLIIKMIRCKSFRVEISIRYLSFRPKKIRHIRPANDRTTFLIRPFSPHCPFEASVGPDRTSGTVYKERRIKRGTER